MRRHTTIITLTAIFGLLAVGLLAATPIVSQGETPEPTPTVEARWEFDVSSLNVRMEPGHSAAFSPDGRFIALGSSGGFSVYAVEDGAELWAYVTDLTIQSLAWSPDGQYIAAGTSDAQYLPDTNAMIGGGSGGVVLLFDAESGAEQWGFPIDPSQPAIYGLTFSPDSSRLAYVPFAPLGPVILDVASGETILSLVRSGLGDLLSAAWSPDGALVAGGYDPDRVDIWDAETGTLLHAASSEWRGTAGGVTTLAFSPDSGLIVSGARADPLYVFDTGSGELSQSLIDILEPHRGSTALAFSSDGGLLASANYGGIVLWDTQVWQQIAIIPAPGIRAVIFTPDTGILLAASQDGMLYRIRWFAR